MELKQSEGVEPSRDWVKDKLESARRQLKFIQLKFIERTRPSRELSLTITKIDEALLWLSKVSD